MQADVIVIGAGINGLVAATRLAMAGRAVVLLDRREVVGGRAAPYRFHERFSAPGLLSDTSGMRPALWRELGLDLKRDTPGRRPATWHAGQVRAVDELRWEALQHWSNAVAPVLQNFLDDQPLDLLHPERMSLPTLLEWGWDLRRLGKATMRELLRVPPLNARDWAEEWFDDPRDVAALCAEGLLGSWLSPRSPGGALSLLFQRAVDAGAVEGGTTALIDSLNLHARRAGVQFKLDAEVVGLDVEFDRVCGVTLADGEQLRAHRVLSTVAPNRTMLDWLPRGRLPWRTRRRYEAWRTRGTTAQLLLGLDRAPASLRDQEFAQSALEPDDIERAFDGVKYGRMPEQPTLLIHHASLRDPSLVDGEGAVLSVLIHSVPHDLEGGWHDGVAEQLFNAVTAQLDRCDSSLRERVVASELLTPTMIEQRYGLPGGQVHHGEQALDQMLIRPEPDAFAYRTPIAGLWLGGGGSHPGGFNCGAPGRLAAARMLTT